MNLRLDKDSIRVRITLEEAQVLLELGKLEERLPLLAQLRVKMTSEATLALQLIGVDLELSVPRDEVARMTASFALAEKPGKKELCISRAVPTPEGGSMLVEFEVDRFSSRRAPATNPSLRPN